MFSVFDLEMMARAVVLARRGHFTTMPNPRVGCVLVQAGQVVGEGWHRRAGEPHAEIYALREAGDRAKGATVYVTLEPCSHHGRTPPCVEALLRAGVARVVYGMEDPNPRVAGSGIALLRKAGVQVEGPLLEPEVEKLNRGFIKRQRTGLPWVRLKLAMSLDGRTAMASGESQWITGPAARSDVQRLRAGSCAIVTGIETVLKDNPSMTVRAEQLGLEKAGEIASRQPLRVVVDSGLRIPADANILRGERVLVATARSEGEIPNGEIVSLPNDSGVVDLAALLADLAGRECNEVLVEAGAVLSGAFVQQGLVDELVCYMAPTLLGSDARPLLNLPMQTMAEKMNLKIEDLRAVGNDWRIVATPGDQG